MAITSNRIVASCTLKRTNTSINTCFFLERLDNHIQVVIIMIELSFPREVETKKLGTDSVYNETGGVT